MSEQKRRSPRAQALLQFGMLCGIVLCVNLVASAFYTHLDLTEEKRFTLTKPTRELLGALKDRVYVEILLEGEFPAGFKRLQTATREMLDDFRSETGYVDYLFDDPSKGSVDDVNSRRKNLSEIGINPINLQVQEQGERTQKLIYPVAIFHYRGRNIPVKLLENESPSLSPDEVINNSVSLLEYKFANAIKKMQEPTKPIILFTDGHGELDKDQTADLEKSLRTFYEPGRVVLDCGAVTRRKMRAADRRQTAHSLQRKGQIQGGSVHYERRQSPLARGSDGRRARQHAPQWQFSAQRLPAQPRRSTLQIRRTHPTRPRSGHRKH
jgi:ABC-2 type transport system permease protein